MKILIYSIHYTPHLTGIGKYTGEMAAWLAAKGHNVRVVTAYPYYPQWKIARGYAGWQYGKEEIDGVKVWRCPLYVPASPTGLKRLVHLASFAVSSMPVMLRQIFWQPDLIFVIEPAFFCVPLAWFVARVSGAKAWLHIQDFEVDAAFALGILSFKWMQAIISLIEKWLMSRFDRVSSISEKMVERLAEKGLAREKLVLFPNWANIEEMKFDRKKAAKFRSNIGFKENDFIILYSGNMGKKQGLEIVLEAAERLKDYKEIRFVLCGEGAVKPELQAKALKMGLSNTVFLPLQSEDNFPGLLFAADLHLIIQKASAADIVFPSKLANILSAGGVALVTTEPDTALGQLKAKFPDIFFTIPPEDVDALVKAIVDIYFQMRKEKCIKLPYAAAREFAEKFLSKEMILSSFGEHLMTLFSTTPGI